MTTLMYGTGVTAPNVPWLPVKRTAEAEPFYPPLPTFAQPDVTALTQAVVALSARMELLAAEVAELKLKKPKRKARK